MSSYSCVVIHVLIHYTPKNNNNITQVFLSINCCKSWSLAVTNRLGPAWACSVTAAVVSVGVIGTSGMFTCEIIWSINASILSVCFPLRFRLYITEPSWAYCNPRMVRWYDTKKSNAPGSLSFCNFDVDQGLLRKFMYWKKWLTNQIAIPLLLGSVGDDRIWLVGPEWYFTQNRQTSLWAFTSEG